ncbi:MAG TPA: HPr family phosphocarrier protein [Kiritimatiellia bacterium]|nr:HPr family phosphocarrier protein [Kiritimatiellia bacterium]
MRLTRCIKVRNIWGICARPAALIVKMIMVRAADHEVTMQKENQQVSARSIMGLLTLEGYCGSEIIVTVEGPEADRVLNEIEKLFDEKFGWE